MKFQTLIVDDEPLARKRITDLLIADKSVNIIDECKNGYEAISILHNKPCDLLFLDIQMPDIDGFGVIESLDGFTLPATIFTTAYDQYAIKAFSVHAVDYLLKPFDDDNFYRALENAKTNIHNKSIGNRHLQLNTLLKYLYDNNLPFGGITSIDDTKPNYQKQFAIKNNGKIYFVKTASVQWIEATGNYVCLHTSKGRHLIRATIGAIDVKLEPDKFIRIHRSLIVNVEYIKEIEPYTHGEYVFKMKKGNTLYSSRSYNSSIQTYLKKYF